MTISELQPAGYVALMDERSKHWKDLKWCNAISTVCRQVIGAVGASPGGSCDDSCGAHVAIVNYSELTRGKCGVCVCVDVLETVHYQPSQT